MKDPASPQPDEQIDGATVLARTLKAGGVCFVFLASHPDTEAVATAIEKEDGLRMIRPVSEISCVPMADACARQTGRPTVSITAGPGHILSQVMGATTAWGDKSPVISIGISRDADFSASPVFDRETVNPEDVFSPVSVYHTTVKRVDHLAPAVARGIRESVSAKGGTVFLRIPHTVIKAGLPGSSRPAAIVPAGEDEINYHAQAAVPPAAEPEKISQAADLLAAARHPFIFAGGGVLKSGATDAVNTLAEKTGIPILSSMGALDAVYPNNPMYVGPSSYLGGEAFHKAIKKADVVLAVGACFSGLDGFGLPPLWSEDIQFIQINIDHRYIALNPGASLAIVADAGQVIGQLEKLLEKRSDLPDWSAWHGYLKRQNRTHEKRLQKEARAHVSRDGRLHPAAALLEAKETIEAADAIAVVDGGNTPLWAGMTIAIRGPRRMFFPTGEATLGLGIPMALGMKAAVPDKPVILLTGDGSLLYNIQELELMKAYGLPITIVVNNDSAWNMIRAGEVMINRSVSTELPAQDYTETAAAFGMKVNRIGRLEEIRPAIKEALKTNEPRLIDIPTDKNVYPDSLASFIRVEFMGSLFPQPFKKIRRMHQSQVRLFGRNTRNIIRYLLKTF